MFLTLAVRKSALTFCLYLVTLSFFSVAAIRAQTASTTPKITSVATFSGPSTHNDKDNSQITYIIEITGTNFDKIPDLTKARIIPFPSTGVSSVSIISRSTDGTNLIAQFAAPVSYVLGEIALYDGTNIISGSTTTSVCDKAELSVSPLIVPFKQAKTLYGDGIGSNFYAIDINIVNHCQMPIDVPLAGIQIQAAGGQTDGKDCTVKPNLSSNLTPFPLAHLTSIYTQDRKLTGTRAKYFNALQAAATLGSGIQPFFGPGFTQAVAIFGGAFTTASKEIFIDMSSEQLQNLTSQSFGSVEQLQANGGSLQKKVFISRIPDCVKKHKNDPNSFDANITGNNFQVNYTFIPASAQPPQSAIAQAVTPQAQATAQAH